MREEDLLINRLKHYGKTGIYPFHMPGHKRLKWGEEADGRAFYQGMEFPNPFEVDITEIDGFDNLHHPEGILKESMEWAAWSRPYPVSGKWKYIGAFGGCMRLCALGRTDSDRA